MGRSYPLPTVKALFAEASACAYPNCAEPLVFRDRNKVTVVADIAHIRSEQLNGPRHDPNYTDDLDGVDNLLLLCGKHHRPVDRHESTYTIEELVTWKVAQVAAAGGGTPLSETDLRSFVRLSDDERQVISGIARLAQRIISVCLAAQDEIEIVRGQNERLRLDRFYSHGPIRLLDENGNDAGPLDPSTYRLAHVEQREWDAKVLAAWEQRRPQAEAALTTLHEEVAVLRMMGPLGDPAILVIAAASLLQKCVGDRGAMNSALRQLNDNVKLLWQIANGEAELDEASKAYLATGH